MRMPALPQPKIEQKKPSILEVVKTAIASKKKRKKSFIQVPSKK